MTPLKQTFAFNLNNKMKELGITSADKLLDLMEENATSSDDPPTRASVYNWCNEKCVHIPYAKNQELLARTLKVDVGYFYQQIK